ncbi:MAG TPA: Maf family protein [Solirubrobacterales bacterium]|nr:Maf family protein [Solirubrobacterales bacterium]
MKLVLASASPRRRELLTLLGLEFEAVATGVPELTGGDPAVIVVENALRKARAVDRPGATVLGVDTDVVCDGRLLGKPVTDGDATARLRALSGRTHEVLSGIALRTSWDARERSELVRTAVTFRDLSDREIEAYVASGEWRDRAGGYAVQGLGSALVERVEGDLSNVIGLPIPALSRMIAELQDG